MPSNRSKKLAVTEDVSQQTARIAGWTALVAFIVDDDDRTRRAADLMLTTSVIGSALITIGVSAADTLFVPGGVLSGVLAMLKAWRVWRRSRQS